MFKEDIWLKIAGNLRMLLCPVGLPYKCSYLKYWPEVGVLVVYSLFCICTVLGRKPARIRIWHQYWPPVIQRPPLINQIRSRVAHKILEIGQYVPVFGKGFIMILYLSLWFRLALDADVTWNFFVCLTFISSCSWNVHGSCWGVINLLRMSSWATLSFHILTCCNSSRTEVFKLWVVIHRWAMEFYFRGYVFLIEGHGQNYESNLSWMFADFWEYQMAFITHCWIFFPYENHRWSSSVANSCILVLFATCSLSLIYDLWDNTFLFINFVFDLVYLSKAILWKNILEWGVRIVIPYSR